MVFKHLYYNLPLYLPRRMAHERTLTLETMNQGVKNMEYCIRGPLELRAMEIEKEIESGGKKPFRYVIRANIDNPHAKLQKPITFFRQIMAVMLYPELLKTSKFPSDVKIRAEEILDSFGNRSMGSYTPSTGNLYIRTTIANYIKKRDGYPANPDDIVVCMGAADGIMKTLVLMAQKQAKIPTGIMIPVPAYPLYNALVVENKMHAIGYYLDESAHWRINTVDLKRALDEHRNKCQPRAIVVINPNNPTGSLLNEKNIKEIIQFAYDEKLVLIADEVYQSNVYDSSVGFHSFKKCLMSLGEPYNRRELIAITSLSKGYVAEAGLRGGCMEVMNMWPQVRANFYKMITASLCPPSTSQSLLAMSLKPPKRGDPSYNTFKKEKNDILRGLRNRAAMCEKFINTLPGLKVSKVQGSMFAFPRIDMPEKAIKTAKAENIPPDEKYCRELLEEYGVCVLPGSGFGQMPDTWHFRISLLQAEDLFAEMLNRIRDFHIKFMNKYK